MVHLGLQSSFRDYYDHWFERSFAADTLFHRNTRTAMTKADQFQHLATLGWNVVPHGTAESLTENYGNIGMVIYDDPYAHCGEGKYLSHLTEDNGQKLASLFLDSPCGTIATSYRYLFIGDRAWLLRYRNHDHSAWKSNYGSDLAVDLLLEVDPAQQPCVCHIRGPWPLYAVDILYRTTAAGGATSYAIDLNTAPQIQGTGLERILLPQDCFALLAAYITRTGEVGL